MGEMWMGLWILTFLGLFIIVVAIYDYFDRKKRKQEIKKWKYFVVIGIGFLLMYPVITGVLFTLPKFFRRK